MSEFYPETLNTEPEQGEDGEGEFIENNDDDDEDWKPYQVSSLWLSETFFICWITLLTDL